MPDPSALLRDAEVLRKLLTECLRRVDRLERSLRTEAAHDEAEPTAPPLTDPFEQALPEPEERPANENGAAAMPPRRRPSVPGPASDSTIRTLPLPPSRPGAQQGFSSPHPGAKPARSPEPQRAPKPRETDREASAPSGDGTLDPFAFLDMSVPPSEPDDVEVYRGMHALLGGLDVSPPHDA